MGKLDIKTLQWLYEHDCLNSQGKDVFDDELMKEQKNKKED